MVAGDRPVSAMISSVVVAWKPFLAKRRRAAMPSGMRLLPSRGATLRYVVARLASRNWQFLWGHRASTQERDCILAELYNNHTIRRVASFYSEYVGADQLIVIGAIEIRGEHIQRELAQTLRKAEGQLMQRPDVVRAVLTLAASSAKSITPENRTDRCRGEPQPRPDRYNFGDHAERGLSS